MKCELGLVDSSVWGVAFDISALISENKKCRVDSII